ncbi:MAG: fumarylacetoacetate hydrolase family protein [Anaerolineae bacterium]
MKLLTYDGGQKLGLKTENGVLDLAAAANAHGLDAALTTPDALYQAGLAALTTVRTISERENAGFLLDERTLTLGPCVPQPGKILCVGLNYRKHAAESGAEPPKTPVLFSKFNNAIAAPNDAVPLPTNASRFDYEAELVVVIGKRAKYVSVEDALSYVLGYCNGNDISERELQMRTGQWLLGKTLDKFMPVGPYLVTADEVGDPQGLTVRCWLNGELRQNSNTADMIFSVAEIISYASQYMTLEPGDIISTGTPEGVILGMSEKVWMKPGDEVTVEIGNLGRLTNTLVAENA